MDVRATGRLNKLYTALLRDNPDSAADARRSDMNHFMARLIFCFFAEDTDIFNGQGLFTQTLHQFSAADGSDTHVVLSEIFRAMNIRPSERAQAQPRLPSWADGFPYVNGGLFSGSTAAPRFGRMARTHLLHAGRLTWQQINPDIFGSMIQAVADDAERASLGMHYTSVPNILKVLNPLFLDDLRAQLQAAGDNKSKLLNLRKRMARIRVFDPACGSGNFLVIAYKQMRQIEAEINRRRDEAHRRSDIPLTNFRGIELRDFPAEMARLALVIAEFQCDVLYRGQKDAVAEFLPLDTQNWITCGNALRLDWVRLMDVHQAGVKLVADDLFESPLDQAEVDFQHDIGETFICGNPPYLGSTWQDKAQKADLESVFAHRCKHWKSLDYVAGWFMKAADFATHTPAAAAFVSTNSICQGQQVPILWPLIFATGNRIHFAHTSFKWANLASYNAGVTVVIVGLSRKPTSTRRLYAVAHTPKGDAVDVKEVNHINAYLVAGADVMVEKRAKPLSAVAEMSVGNKPVDGGHLLLSRDEVAALGLSAAQRAQWVRRIYGSAEFIRGLERHCLWLDDASLDEAMHIPAIRTRIEAVRAVRLGSPKAATVQIASTPHRFGEIRQTGTEVAILIPRVSSESRPYLPAGAETSGVIVSDAAFALYDAPLWHMALIASRLHLVWIATVCGKLKTDFRYSNTIGWNTFPVPFLTQNNKVELTRCAEAILLAREVHFPNTIADLYDVKDGISQMPDNLRHAHEYNDEVIERIYIGRCFKNDTERLEKLFQLYTQMTAAASHTPAPKSKSTSKRGARAS